MTEATQAPVASDREIIMERDFDAPPALVYQVWTDPAHLPHWFGPKGFTITTKAIDVRPGGGWEFTMHGPDGKDWPNYMHFVALQPDARIDYETGEYPNQPPHFTGCVTFTAIEGGTRLRMKMTFPSAEACAAVKGFGAVELGYQTLQKLADRVDALCFRYTRTFDAPRELVYLAFAEAERLAKWWGPKDFQLDIKHLDFQPGGRFHYRCHNEAGMEMWGMFQYLVTETPRKLVYVTSFADAEGNVRPAPIPDFPLRVYNLVTFAETGGKTTLQLTAGPLDAPPEHQDAFRKLTGSLHQGFAGTFDQLEAYLASAR